MPFYSLFSSPLKNSLYSSALCGLATLGGSNAALHLMWLSFQGSVYLGFAYCCLTKKHGGEKKSHCLISDPLVLFLWTAHTHTYPVWGLLPSLSPSPGRHWGKTVLLPEGLWQEGVVSRGVEWEEERSHRLSRVFLKILSSLFLYLETISVYNPFWKKL